MSEPFRLETYRRALDQYDAADGKEPFPLVSPFPEQRPEFFYPGLDTRIVHPPADFPWVEELERGFPQVVEEWRGLLARRTGFTEVYAEHTDRGRWGGCYLSIFGRPVEEVAALCPRTLDLLRTVPGATEYGTALISALAPGTRVAEHCGTTNAKLRCQLPLQVPEDCGLQVAGRVLDPAEGRCTVFDDSFVHHAWNLGSAPRFVLIFDFFHPGLEPVEVDFLVRRAREARSADYYLDFLEKRVPAEWAYE